MSLGAIPAKGQDTCVIADVETRVPLRDVLIHMDNGVWSRTDYRGHFVIKYPFDSAEVTKKGYLKTFIYAKAMPDTLFLLPEAEQLGTVEVWGKANQQIRHMTEQVKQEAAEQPRAVTGISLDILGVFDKRARRDRKHLKKAKELIREMDEKGDPIIDSYEQATGHKYGEKEQEEKPEGENVSPVARTGEEDSDTE